jgi:hypothetical protein
MVIECAAETTGDGKKMQCLQRQTSEDGNSRNKNLMPVLCECHCFYRFGDNRMSVTATSLNSVSGRNISPTQNVVYK